MAESKNNRKSNDNYLVTIHVDQTALQGKAGRSALPINVGQTQPVVM